MKRNTIQIATLHQPDGDITLLAVGHDGSAWQGVGEESDDECYVDFTDAVWERIPDLPTTEESP